MRSGTILLVQSYPQIILVQIENLLKYRGVKFHFFPKGVLIKCKTQNYWTLISADSKIFMTIGQRVAEIQSLSFWSSLDDNLQYVELGNWGKV